MTSPRPDAAGAIDAMLTVITKSLKKKKSCWSAFGTFQVSKRKGGRGRNPQTGEKIKSPPPRAALQGEQAAQGSDQLTFCRTRRIHMRLRAPARLMSLIEGRS